jgi:hypothetical protein
VAACFSRHVEALDWAEQRLIGAWGPLASRSADYDFHHTTYYAAAMGTGLQKRLLVFAQSRSPACLAMAKNYAIGLENALASQRRFAEARPLNVDPGLHRLKRLRREHSAVRGRAVRTLAVDLCRLPRTIRSVLSGRGACGFVPAAARRRGRALRKCNSVSHFSSTCYVEAY